MAPSGPRNSDTSPNLLVEIVETLEAHGLPSESYQLHDAVDVEALEQLLASSTGNVEVRFTVEEIQLSVTQDGVDVILDEPAGTPNQ
ncbi:HalOD1 output domain-containing protein [Halorubrum sp. BV1]|uniref:HalOD1 output domain-containing protein n=1 Tax=Halorubrum sp. BV1 TaxID=1498500 RepID=UPI0006794F7D|nr:HalOD1 output domain-containing protein [Halorubrum sp. BV1]